MASKKTPAPRPAEVFAERVREVREARRWNQQALADRLGRMGEPTDRATVARTESGKRGISLNDGFLYAAALGPSLLNLVLPLDPDRPLAIGRSSHPARLVRRWLYDQQALPGADREDLRAFYTQVPLESLQLLENHTMRELLRQVQALTDALEQGQQEEASDALAGIAKAVQRLQREESDGAR